MSKIKINDWGYYEIDFYNHGTEEEKQFLSKLSKHEEAIGVFFKNGTNWSKRLSGMTFRISAMNYYPKLKEYLDHKLNIYLRKSKLQKISQHIPDSV